MRNTQFLVVLLVLAGILATGALCWGSPALVLVGRGNGPYELLAQGFEDVRDIDLAISYDPATLAEPRIKPKDLVFGAMMKPDYSTSGTIRVNIRSIKPQGIKGSGSIATLSFTMTAQNEGSVTAFGATLISTKGNAIPLPNPKILTLPRPAPVVADIDEFSAAPLENSATTPPEAKGASQGKDVVAGGGTVPGRTLLDRFKEYAGPFTIKAVTALFNQPAVPGFRQVPQVALSDGATKVTAYVDMNPTDGQSSNFALTGAKLLSLKLTGTEYVLELVPESGVYEASITVLNQGRLTEYPLVVAPPLGPGVPFDDATFTAYLNSYATEKELLRKKGQTNYHNLYQYTVNYLDRKRPNSIK